VPDEIGLPVSVGLAVGFAFVALFSILSLPTHNYIGKEISTVIIPEGASSETNPPFLVPETIKVKIGVNNTVRWVSQDSVPHAITTDDDYTDPYSGSFDTRERAPENGGAFIMPGESFEFTFTKAGEHSYHGEPHPWMQGTVIVLPP
jgi:plastocyanin